MGRVALRGVRAHLVRFCLSVLAVALGVAFVAGTFALRTMLGSTFTDIVATTTLGDAYVQGAEPVGGTGGPDRISPDGRNPVPLTLVDELEDVDGVAAVLPDAAGPDRAGRRRRHGRAEHPGADLRVRLRPARTGPSSGRRARAGGRRRDRGGVGDAGGVGARDRRRDDASCSAARSGPSTVVGEVGLGSRAGRRDVVLRRRRRPRRPRSRPTGTVAADLGAGGRRR